MDAFTCFSPSVIHGGWLPAVVNPLKSEFEDQVSGLPLTKKTAGLIGKKQISSSYSKQRLSAAILSFDIRYSAVRCLARLPKQPV